MDQNEPLFLAIKEGNIRILKKLLKKGMDINTKTDYHKNLLGIAIYHGHIKIVKLLISKGADVNASDKEGSLLHLAAEFDTQNHLQIAKLLIEAGADVNAKKEKQIDEFDLKLMDHGIMNDDDQEATTRPLHEAVKTGNIKMIKLLILNGADVNAVNERYNSSLHLAAKDGNKNIVKFLLQKGAPVNLRNNSKRTPLYIAIKNDNKHAAKLIKKFGGQE